jgi:hypothetical protein
MKLYEEEYIDEKIIRVIQTYIKRISSVLTESSVFNRYLPELRGILLDITDKIEGRTAGRQLPEPIKTKPFNLTVSKARIVPIPKTVRINLFYLCNFFFNLDNENGKISTTTKINL